MLKNIDRNNLNSIKIINENFNQIQTNQNKYWKPESSAKVRRILAEMQRQEKAAKKVGLWGYLNLKNEKGIISLLDQQIVAQKNLFRSEQGEIEFDLIRTWSRGINSLPEPLPETNIFSGIQNHLEYPPQKNKTRISLDLAIPLRDPRTDEEEYQVEAFDPAEDQFCRNSSESTYSVLEES